MMHRSRYWFLGIGIVLCGLAFAASLAGRAQASLSGYHSAWVSQSVYPTLAPGQSGELEIRIRNSGTVIWMQGQVFLGASGPRDRVPVFSRGTGWASQNRIRLIEPSVLPGDIGTFRFTITVPAGLAAGTYREYFQPVAEYITWMEDQGIYWDITVPNQAIGYQSQWVGQSDYVRVGTSESAQFEVRLKNIGSATWSSSTVFLGTSGPRDRVPVFSRGTGWASQNRIRLVESSVLPGDIGTFRFEYLVPKDLAAGTYREYFQPVAEYITWMNDQGIYWDVTVTSPQAPANPLSAMKLWVDPLLPAAKTAADWQVTRPADAEQIRKIAAQPHAVWLSGRTPSITEAVTKITQAYASADSQGAVPTFVLYTIPQRDCGGLAAGGFGAASDYRAWVDAVVGAIGTRQAIAIVEPDAIPGMDCLSATDQQTRFDLIKYAVTSLKKNPGTIVYIDAGNPAWKPASVIVPRLQQASIELADGFAINVANFRTTDDNITFGTTISQQVGGKHFVIDTGRNGLGPDPNGIWCNPPGRALGARPTTNTDNSLVDAFLWIKQPGFSDGACRNSAVGYGWWPDYALGLAQRAAY